MGCSISKQKDEEAVQICRDRKHFIKQAVEQRTRFASGHLAYIQALKKVSAAVRNYFEADEHQGFVLDSFVTPPLTPAKKGNSGGYISISPQSFSPAKLKAPHNSAVQLHYLRSGGNQAVSVEERPRSPETYRVESYSPLHHSGIESFFTTQSSPMRGSSYPYYASNVAPPSPQTSQWDFWNPFTTTSFDYYGYPHRTSIDQMVMEDDVRGLNRVREEEGIPELEDETEHEEMNDSSNIVPKRAERSGKYGVEEVSVEDVDEDDEEEETEDSECECECECEPVHVVRDMKNSQNDGNEKLSRSQEIGHVAIKNKEIAVPEREVRTEKPGFTVYVKRRPTCMAEVIKELEDQFEVACTSAKEVASLMESNRAQYMISSSDLSALKMLNPVALFRSASSLSSSSRYLLSSSTSKDDIHESSSDYSEESCSSMESHQSTLDRLYAWEKKLYEEVKSGEKVRLAYEKKCLQLRNQDVSGEDPFAVDKTRATIRDLHTQIKVSIHTVEAISKRIEALRDEELQPQLIELVKGLARMWKVMEECHRNQKRTLDDAKILLANTPSKLTKKQCDMPIWDPQRLARSASYLEAELRNWRSCFEAWITSQRSYVQALCGWLLRCIRSGHKSSNLLLSPRRSGENFPILGFCLQWSKLLDSVNEKPVLDGIDFFSAGMGYVKTHQLRDNYHRVPIGSKRYVTSEPIESGGDMDIVEYCEVDEAVMASKTVEVANRILIAGMSVAVNSLTEFATRAVEGFADLVKQWDNT